MFKLLFVCTGNICRSPTAHGVLRHMVEHAGLGDTIWVDSAGIHRYHVGEMPDPRTIQTAASRGYQLDDLIARHVTPMDYTGFDLILAMDRGHETHLKQRAPTNSSAKVSLFLEHAGHAPEQEVPDPYYGTQDDFEYVLDLVEQGSEKLLQRIKREYL